MHDKSTWTAFHSQTSLHNWISSVSHPVSLSLSLSLSLFIPFPPPVTLVCSAYAFTWLHGVRRLSARQIRLKANCPLDLIQIYFTRNSLTLWKNNFQKTSQHISYAKILTSVPLKSPYFLSIWIEKTTIKSICFLSVYLTFFHTKEVLQYQQRHCCWFYCL